MLSYFARQEGADLAVSLARVAWAFPAKIVIGQADRQLPAKGQSRRKTKRLSV
jgi:hypothetical protein